MYDFHIIGPCHYAIQDERLDATGVAGLPYEIARRDVAHLHVRIHRRARIGDVPLLHLSQYIQIGNTQQSQVVIRVLRLNGEDVAASKIRVVRPEHLPFSKSRTVQATYHMPRRQQHAAIPFVRSHMPRGTVFRTVQLWAGHSDTRCQQQVQITEPFESTDCINRLTIQRERRGCR